MESNKLGPRHPSDELLQNYPVHTRITAMSAQQHKAVQMRGQQQLQQQLYVQNFPRICCVARGGAAG